MSHRYFLEVAYKGSKYSGFQRQYNGKTIQGEIENAFKIFFKADIHLTGSSRTDAGVHARQNYFHFDFQSLFNHDWLYNLNAILPQDIVLKNVIEVLPEAHCRFDAISREYHYCIYDQKDPFVQDLAYFYPYHLSIDLLQKAALLIKDYTDFLAFSKKHMQVKTTVCKVFQSEWMLDEEKHLVYKVEANRFLRGMVRALTATMLKVGRAQISLDDLVRVLDGKEQQQFVSFDVPGHGLTLQAVRYDWHRILLKQ